jgi:ribonuclease P protein component
MEKPIGGHFFMSSNTLGRSERLKSEKAINQLFETGTSLSVNPVRLIYQMNPATEKFPVKIGFAVPKKNFKRAVDRNLLKRRMREAYRLNKSLIAKEILPSFSCLEIMLIYQSRKIEDYDKIRLSIIDLLKKLSSKII